jgi:glycosyltransferase involved in cell wall biosynthesis
VTGRSSTALTFVVPGDLETRTGGYEYDRRIVAGLRARGWTVGVVRLDERFPQPTPAIRAEAARALAAVPDGAIVVIDGLALGALPDEIASHAARLTIVALVHHPLAAETGLEPPVADALRESERRALSYTRAVVVTSRRTAAALEAYGVDRDRIAVVEPGTDPAPLARGSQSTIPSPITNHQSTISTLALLCVATLTPRKGHDLLLRALASLPARNWRLTCAGSLDRDPPTASRVHALVRALDLEGRVTLAGDLNAERLAIEYDRSDLFVLPTLYEGYGMAVAEALARGLPIVSTATGAIPDIVGDDAGIVVPPGDAGAFSDALARVVGDGVLRERFSAGARRAREGLPTWDAAAAAMACVLIQIK